MTVFPASGAAGKSGKALTGTVTTTMSPAAAASPLVAADARGPSSAAASASVSGPRELLRVRARGRAGPAHPAVVAAAGDRPAGRDPETGRPARGRPVSGGLPSP